MRSGAYAHSRKLHWLSSGLTDWTETTEVDNRRIGDDDIVYVDLGPVFEAWEADYGRTFVVGADPVKHALNRDLGVAFAQVANQCRELLARSRHRHRRRHADVEKEVRLVGCAADSPWRPGADRADVDHAIDAAVG